MNNSQYNSNFFDLPQNYSFFMSQHKNHLTIDDAFARLSVALVKIGGVAKLSHLEQEIKGLSSLYHTLKSTRGKNEFSNEYQNALDKLKVKLDDINNASQKIWDQCTYNTESVTVHYNPRQLLSNHIQNARTLLEFIEEPKKEITYQAM